MESITTLLRAGFSNYMNPAALKALVGGDIENFLVASTPGGIEAQEKRGQMQQATMEIL